MFDDVESWVFTSYGDNKGLEKAVPQSIDRRGQAIWIQLQDRNSHSGQRAERSVIKQQQVKGTRVQGPIIKARHICSGSRRLAVPAST